MRGKNICFEKEIDLIVKVDVSIDDNNGINNLDVLLTNRTNVVDITHCLSDQVLKDLMADSIDKVKQLALI